MDICIRGIKFPSTVKGVTVQDEKGNFNIYVNTLLCDETKEQTYKHELRHIELMHFKDRNPVILNELEVVNSL